MLNYLSSFKTFSMQLCQRLNSKLKRGNCKVSGTNWMSPRREWHSSDQNLLVLRQKSKSRARSSYPTGGFCEGAKSSDTWTLVGDVLIQEDVRKKLISDLTNTNNAMEGTISELKAKHTNARQFLGHEKKRPV